MQGKRYPKIFIRSKSELAKHISHRGLSRFEAQNLINDVISHYDNFWKDSKESDPKKEKYVRTAKGTPLGLLLQKIDEMVFAPHDRMLPNYIFSGVKGKNHAEAGKHLLGTKKRRTFLKIDIKRFFEQISETRVVSLLKNKCQCSKKAARLIGFLCCVPLGPKGSTSSIRTIARGFATSSRLAIWCNLDHFIKLEWLIKKMLKGQDPRIMIYVDDIGISATHTTMPEMESIYKEVQKIFFSDHNQKLQLHTLGGKSKIMLHNKNPIILGLELHRNKLRPTNKTRFKILETKAKLKSEIQPREREENRNRLNSLLRYQNYIKNL